MLDGPGGTLEQRLDRTIVRFEGARGLFTQPDQLLGGEMDLSWVCILRQAKPKLERRDE